MRQQALIGIDTGSTHVKAAAFSLGGERLALARRRVTVHHSRPGFSEYDAGEIYGAVGECLREILATGIAPLAVGIASFGESVVPLGENGEPVDKAIAWFDDRGQPQLDKLLETISPERLFALTGQFPSPKFTLAKLLWLREHRPGLLASVNKFAFMQDYVALRLTGQLATEYSLASRSMLFDVAAREWSGELLEFCGISRDQLPRVVPSGEIAGRVRAEAAAQTGLRSGIPVCLTGHDHASATFAAGLHREGPALDSLGTSETSMLAAANVDESLLYRRGIGFYPYRRDDAPLRCIASIQACGASIEWAAGLLFEGEALPRFFAAAEQGRAAGDLPLFLPFPRGLQERPGMLASFRGLRDIHDRPALCLAVLEGLCFEHRRRLEDGEACTGQRYPVVRAAGRLSSQQVFMQCKADILGRRVEVLAEEEAVSQGAAMQAGFACGAVDRYLPGIRAVYEPARPQGERYERYLELLFSR